MYKPYRRYFVRDKHNPPYPVIMDRKTFNESLRGMKDSPHIKKGLKEGILVILSQSKIPEWDPRNALDPVWSCPRSQDDFNPDEYYADELGAMDCDACRHAERCPFWDGTEVIEI